MFSSSHFSKLHAVHTIFVGLYNIYAEQNDCKKHSKQLTKKNFPIERMHSAIDNWLQCLKDCTLKTTSNNLYIYNNTIKKIFFFLTIWRDYL